MEQRSGQRGSTSYHNISAHDQASIHNGDVYNYRDTDSEERRILEWLTPLNPSKNHNQALKQYQEGTLGWFFDDDPRFSTWRDGHDIDQPPTLWCWGELGTGKTTLAAQAWNRLRSGICDRGQLAVAYCRYSERQSQTAEHLLGSLLAQLFAHAESGYDIPQPIRDCYNSQTYREELVPRMTQLQDWLQARCESHSRPFVLVDAIDELDSLVARRLLHALQSSNLKLLVTSRNIPTLRYDFANHVEIGISARTEDLFIMALARFDDESQTSAHFKQSILRKPAHNTIFADVQDEVLSRVFESTKHMFIMASIHLDSILECTTVQDVYYYLDNIPLKMEDLYDQAWTRATGDGRSPRMQRAKLALMWISHAREPLSLNALSEALLASQRIKNEGDDFPAEELISSCAGLVRLESSPVLGAVISSRETTIALSHFSVQQYLEARQKTHFPQADDSIVGACRFHENNKRHKRRNGDATTRSYRDFFIWIGHIFSSLTFAFYAYDARATALHCVPVLLSLVYNTCGGCGPATISRLGSRTGQAESEGPDPRF